jgi:hypothetical protein
MAVEKPHLGAKSKPVMETAIRNRRSSVTCAGVILSASLMEREEALFQQPQSECLSTRLSRWLTAYGLQLTAVGVSDCRLQIRRSGSRELQAEGGPAVTRFDRGFKGIGPHHRAFRIAVVDLFRPCARTRDMVNEKRRAAAVPPFALRTELQSYLRHFQPQPDVMHIAESARLG